MTDFAKVVLIIVIGIALIIGLNYSFNAQVDITKIPNYSTDDDLKQISWMLFWAGFISLIGFGLVVWLFFLALTNHEWLREPIGYMAAILAGILAIVAAILSFVANSRLQANSKFKDATDKSVSRDAIIAGVANLVGVVLIIVSVIWIFRTIKRVEPAELERQKEEEFKRSYEIRHARYLERQKQREAAQSTPPIY